MLLKRGTKNGNGTENGNFDFFFNENIGERKTIIHVLFICVLEFCFVVVVAHLIEKNTLISFSVQG